MKLKKQLLAMLISLCLLPTLAFAKQSKGFSKPTKKSGPSRVYTVGSSHTFITGPHGGCYFLNEKGGKTYVERSLCNGVTRTYILGPHGWCYYINSKGTKTFVDRSLCN